MLRSRRGTVQGTAPLVVSGFHFRTRIKEGLDNGGISMGGCEEQGGDPPAGRVRVRPGSQQVSHQSMANRIGLFLPRWLDGSEQGLEMMPPQGHAVPTLFKQSADRLVVTDQKTLFEACRPKFAFRKAAKSSFVGFHGMFWGSLPGNA